MLNMMNRGFLPFRMPTTPGGPMDGPTGGFGGGLSGGPAMMMFNPDSDDTGDGGLMASQSLTPIPFMQPFSETQDYVQPMMPNFMAQSQSSFGQPFNARFRRSSNQGADARAGGYSGFSGMNYGMDGGQSGRLGQLGTAFRGSSYAPRTLPGMADFGGLNPYGSAY